MMNEDTPTRPHRGKQTSKESSGLLMSVIRTLSASESDEQREKEKARLEKEYKKSDRKLDIYINNNDIYLKDVMQIFEVVSSQLQLSREKIKTIKENLSACKKLLHCKRDELKERWLEGVEHKHVMLLLEQIDEVRDVGERISIYISKKHYLHATQLLHSSLTRLNTDLRRVEALKEVTSELQICKERLNEQLIEELHKQLYQRWSLEVFAMRRQGSGRDSFHSFSKSGSGRAVWGGKSENACKNLMDAFNSFSQTKTASSGSSTIHEDVNNPNPEANSQQFIVILVECLALLGKLPEAVEKIKNRMQKELAVIIQKTTQQILEQHPPIVTEEPVSMPFFHGKSDSRDAKLLQELLQVIFEQFRLVVAAHKVVLSCMKSSADHHGIDVHLYSMPDVWSKVQAALQVMLSEYLDLSHLGVAQQQSPAALTEAVTDLSYFFGKKSNVRIKNYSLFKFDASYHAMTMNSYLVEQGLGDLDGTSDVENITNRNEKAAGEKVKYYEKLICQPSPHNITTVFNSLQSFIKEIEEALSCTKNAHCPLYIFISDFIKDGFLARLHIEVANCLEAATKMLDQWLLCKDAHLLKQLKVEKPLFQSTVTVWQCIEGLCWLLKTLPLYSDHFVSMICNTLMNYRETCQAAYRGLTQPDSEDKRIISATWAKDKDISRFLRDLPNWKTLQSGITKDVNLEGEESPEEVAERNSKEAEILTGNLGDQLIPQHEILADAGQLKTLGHLQESLEWFAACIINLTSSITSKSSPGGALVGNDVSFVSDASFQTMASLARDFEELAHTCLLVLHLEVRLHCFYFLLPVSRNGNFVSGIDFQEPDAEVIRLNKDLATIDEALSLTLQPRKCKYIFEGLGPLVASIFMSSIVHIRRINDNGIKKVCRNIFSVQQQLTNITMTRELALDKARQYYELLYHASEEVLNNIVNEGKQFTELEYINILTLLHKSSHEPTSDSLKSNLGRLSDILGDIGVTV